MLEILQFPVFLELSRENSVPFDPDSKFSEFLVESESVLEISDHSLAISGMQTFFFLTINFYDHHLYPYFLRP